VNPTEVLADLAAEGEEFDRLLAALTEDQWTLPTPAPEWTIAHQVAHLAATFRMAGTAAADPAAFMAMTAGLSADFNANVTAALSAYLREPHPVLRERWQAERAAAIAALAAVPAGEVVPWLVRPLPPGVLAGAGLMELFAHGQDVADALGIRPVRTDRLRHVVEFAVRTWDFGYQARKLTPPDVRFRFELTSPSGLRWEFGPDGAEQWIHGPAEDFCLLVTRRRHRDDLALTAGGADANQWLDLAQAYRGPAGPGRRPGQFAARH
jgi:uncharacterized protein (TIGR03084 family)